MTLPDHVIEAGANVLKNNSALQRAGYDERALELVAEPVIQAALQALWKPIESAPKDESTILLLTRTQPSVIYPGRWEETSKEDPLCEDGWIADNCWWNEDDFTHWMPADAIPQPKGEEDA